MSVAAKATTLFPKSTVAVSMTVVGAATAHEALDDILSDGDTTRVQASAVGQEVEVDYSDADVDAIPDAAPIAAVLINWDFTAGGGTGNYTFRPGLVIGGTKYPGTDRTIVGPDPSNYSGFVEVFTTDPSDGKPWTRAKVKAAHLFVEAIAVPTGSPRAGTSILQAIVSQPEVSTLEALGRIIIARVLTLSDISESRTGFKVKGWQTAPTPAVYLAIGSETKGRGPTRSKENQVVFTLPTVVKDKDPVVAFLDLYKRIEEVIEADPSMDGLALDAWVSGVNALVTEEEIAKDLHVSDIFVTVDYRHVRGAP